MITVRARAAEREDDGPALNLLSLPRFTRAELLTFTTPRLASQLVETWYARGFIEWETQAAFAHADQLRMVGDRLEANERLPRRRRLYTGGDVIKVCLAQAASQAGVPMALVPELVPLALRRAVDVIVGRDRRPAAIAVVPDGVGGHAIRRGLITDLAELDTTWRTIIDVDAIIARYVERVAL
jgi:hypothetical protein